MNIAAGFVFAGVLCLVGFAGALWLETHMVRRPVARRVPSSHTGRRRVHHHGDAVAGVGSSRPARPLQPGQRVPSS